MKRYLFVLILAVTSAPVLADSGALAQLVTPAGAREVAREDESVRNYRLVLSGLKRQAATTFAEQEVRVSGRLQRWVWEVPEKRSLDQLTEPLTIALAANTGASVLFQCEDLDCGSSHFWANEIFDNGRLVGRDNQQRYLVAYLPAVEGPDTVVLLYATQRGSRQTQLALDVLTTYDRILPEVVSRQTIEDRLSASSGWLPGMVVSNDQLDVEASAALLEVLTSLSASARQRLFLVVHCYQYSEMSLNQQCSENLGSQLAWVLEERGTRLDIRGHAALVASPRASTDPALRFVFWPRR